MQLVFDFFVGSMEELLVSPLRTFLTHLRMRMSLLLRTTVESTVKVRCYYFNSFKLYLGSGALTRYTRRGRIPTSSYLHSRLELLYQKDLEHAIRSHTPDEENPEDAPDSDAKASATAGVPTPLFKASFIATPSTGVKVRPMRAYKSLAAYGPHVMPVHSVPFPLRTERAGSSQRR
jgi:hypothetical protein